MFSGVSGMDGGMVFWTGRPLFAVSFPFFFMAIAPLTVVYTGVAPLRSISGSSIMASCTPSC